MFISWVVLINKFVDMIVRGYDSSWILISVHTHRCQCERYELGNAYLGGCADRFVRGIGNIVDTLVRGS